MEFLYYGSKDVGDSVMTTKQKELIRCKFDQSLYQRYLVKNLKFYLASKLWYKGTDFELDVILSRPSIMIRNKVQHIRKLQEITKVLWPKEERHLKVNFILAQQPKQYAKYHFDHIRDLSKQQTSGNNPFRLAQKIVQKVQLSGELIGLVVRVKGKRGTRKAAICYTKGLVKRAGSFLQQSSDHFTSELIDNKGTTGIQVSTILSHPGLGLKLR